MSEPVSSAPFYLLAKELKRNGFNEHADRIEIILDGVWTTSSELIAELGQAILNVQNECKPMTTNQKILIKQCLKEVRKAWPGFGFFNWFAFIIKGK